MTYPQPIPYVFLSQVTALGLTPQRQIDKMPYSIYNIRDAIPKENLTKVKALLQTLDITGYVVFNATGGEAIGKEREWPANNWAMLAKLVETELGLHVIFTGEKTKVQEVDRMVKSCCSSKIHNLAGATTLYEFIAMISLAHVVVTIDSAALHIAQSVGTPTVSLHGPEPPLVHAYPDPRNRAIYRGSVMPPAHALPFMRIRKCTADTKINACGRLARTRFLRR